jgi:hypothetical protein
MSSGVRPFGVGGAALQSSIPEEGDDELEMRSTEGKKLGNDVQCVFVMLCDVCGCGVYLCVHVCLCVFEYDVSYKYPLRAYSTGRTLPLVAGCLYERNPTL